MKLNLLKNLDWLASSMASVVSVVLDIWSRVAVSTDLTTREEMARNCP